MDARDTLDNLIRAGRSLRTPDRVSQNWRTVYLGLFGSPRLVHASYTRRRHLLRRGDAEGKLGYDDALDASGVHGVGGAAGAVLTGMFASVAWNADGADGLLFGGTELFVENILGVVVAGGYSAVVTFVLLKVLDKIMGLPSGRGDRDRGARYDAPRREGVCHGDAGAAR